VQVLSIGWYCDECGVWYKIVIFLSFVMNDSTKTLQNLTSSKDKTNFSLGQWWCYGRCGGKCG
jgi:hypothetical protein